MATLTTPHHQHNPNILLLIALTIAAIVLFALSSCSCDYHLRKAKDKCGYTMKRDTVWRKDSVFIHSVSKDTVFNYRQHDTVIVHEGRLTMKYYLHDSVVYLSGKCDTVKVYRDVPFVVNSTELKGSNRWVTTLPFIFVCLLLLLVLYRHK